MEPVTLVVAALGAGLVAMTQAVFSESAKDAYQSLKSHLSRRFAGNAKHQEALAAFEADPEGKAKELAAAVSESKAHEDPAVKEAANSLLAETDPDGQARSKYQMLIKGNVQGVVQGDHADVTMNFGTGPGEPKT
jgi:hypothetical protein